MWCKNRLSCAWLRVIGLCIEMADRFVFFVVVHDFFLFHVPLPVLASTSPSATRLHWINFTV